MSDWDEGMLENDSYWDVDFLIEERVKTEKELKVLTDTLWSKIYNWRKIKKLKQKLEELHYVT